jgi:hypothetical protein
MINKSKNNIIGFLAKIKQYFPFLTPAGAGISLICFFLPWVKVSCATITVEASGARIGGIFWLVFAVALLILISFFYFHFQKQPLTAKLIALFGSALSILVILYKFISSFSGDSADIKFSDFNSVICPGAFGEFIGFILVLLGAIFIVDDAKGQKRIRPARRFPYLKKRRDITEKQETPFESKNKNLA